MTARELAPEGLRFSSSERESYSFGNFADRWLRRTPEAYEGGLNENHVYISDDGARFILRIPRDKLERGKTFSALGAEMNMQQLELQKKVYQLD